MTDFLIKSGVLIAMRVFLFASLFFLLGSDPNNDTKIFIYLAEKDIFEHIYGDGDYVQHPKLLPIFLAPFSYLFGASWFRITVLISDLSVFAILYFGLPKFRGSIWEKVYIAGVFTAPLTAVWAQDEVFAVIPLILLFVASPSGLAIVLVSILSFFTFKSFYIFIPFALACGARTIREFALYSLVFLALFALDHTGRFTPPNSFTTTIWYFSELDPADQKQISTLLFSACSVLVFLVSQFYKLNWKLAYILTMTLFCQVFYHVNFEYFVFIAIPAMIYFMEDRSQRPMVVTSIVWFVLAVSTNVFYALGYTIANIDVARDIHAAAIILTFLAGVVFIFQLFSFAIKYRGSNRGRDSLFDLVR